jgi:hypothetical protein
MTRDDIIHMREQADDWAEEHLQCMGEFHPDFLTVSDERFAALVAAAEREACAKVCEMTYEGAFEGARPCFETPDQCADAIRARGQA